MLKSKEFSIKKTIQQQGGINYMPNKRREKKPLLSDEFLDELANEINEKYGGPFFKRRVDDSVNLEEQNKKDPDQSKKMSNPPA
jgi:hypothetical protein